MADTNHAHQKGLEDLDALVKAVHADKDLGPTSCSWVYECLTDEELKKVLSEIIQDTIKAGRDLSEGMVIRELKELNRAVMERMGMFD